MPHDVHWRRSGRRSTGCGSFPIWDGHGDAGIRQIVVRFGASGYIVRYAVLPADGNILITRIWHGREDRT